MIYFVGILYPKRHLAIARRRPGDVLSKLSAWIMTLIRAAIFRFTILPLLGTNNNCFQNKYNILISFCAFTKK